MQDDAEDRITKQYTIMLFIIGTIILIPLTFLMAKAVKEDELRIKNICKTASVKDQEILGLRYECVSLKYRGKL